MTDLSRTARLIAGLSLLVAIAPSYADDWPQWRGPNRDGISAETGLLQQWPESGPKFVWQIKNLGGGYSTPAVVGNRIYLMDNQGLTDEFVKALDVKDGKVAWSVRVGSVGNPDQRPSYPGARSTPTVDGDMIYALGSDGDLVCLETSSGKPLWQKNLRKDFGGEPGVWAYSESPLVDGDAVLCTPGGKEATLVALDKKTGNVRWKSSIPEAGHAAYASAIVVEAGGVRQYVQLLQKGLVGVAAETGEHLWRYDRPVSRFDANIPTPVADSGIVYVGSAGTGGGAVRLHAKDGKVEPEPLYFDTKLTTAIGGSIKLNDSLYGTTGQAMICIEFATGRIRWQDRALGTAALCFADGRLYLHSEGGVVGLVEPSPDGYREKGRFTPPDRPQHAIAGEKSWAYPVVANGRLYIRDLNALWCYDVRVPGR